MRLPSAIVSTALGMALLPACGGGEATLGETHEPVVYGTDNRVEYFDVPSPEGRARMSESMVAFIPKKFFAASSSAGAAIVAPSWGQADRLCPGEPFVDQPAAASCTGVLVDWDLVLTAGHCARVMRLDDFSVVFGYYYSAPGQMARLESREPVEIVAEALTAEGEERWLDYAWLRLDRPVGAPWEPAPVRAGDPRLAVGERIVSIGAGGGVPFKLDDGGNVTDAREGTLDYFYATTDTSRGSSGGGGFDAQLALTGILAGGEADFAQTEAGCATTERLPDGQQSGERFTYVQRAIEGLCQGGNAKAISTICRTSCGDPCRALPFAPDEGGGCQYAASGAPADWLTTLVVGGVLLFVRRPPMVRRPRSKLRGNLARARRS